MSMVYGAQFLSVPVWILMTGVTGALNEGITKVGIEGYEGKAESTDFCDSN